MAIHVENGVWKVKGVARGGLEVVGEGFDTWAGGAAVREKWEGPDPAAICGDWAPRVGDPLAYSGWRSCGAADDLGDAEGAGEEVY